MAVETLVYRWAGFSPALSLLMPTFAFPYAPRRITTTIRREWNAPLPLEIQFLGFGNTLMPVYHPRTTARLVSCYALFK